MLVSKFLLVYLVCFINHLSFLGRRNSTKHHCTAFERVEFVQSEATSQLP